MYRKIVSTAILAAFVAVLAGPASALTKGDSRNSASAERLLRATSSRAQATSQAQYHGPKYTHSGGR
jgi:hypothetical protein